MSASPNSKNEVKQLNRYPGLRPFVKNDNIIFFGRNTETEQLLDSIRVNQSFILFGKSGLGKSSLINAGIIPRLTAENYCPILIRFYNAKRDPHEIVTEELQKYTSEESISSSSASQKNTLSQLLSRWRGEQKPVLIFDQFEEFFYYDSKKRDSFISELAFVVNNDLVKQAEPLSNKPAILAKKSDVKLLFLIRSDRLNLMNEISEKIPGIFNNRYQLKPLLKEKAEQAVVLPAQIQDEESGQVFFKTQPYEYAPEAIQLILNSLSNKEGEIESSQLQIICQELEEIALAHNINNNEKTKTNSDIIITTKDFKGEAGIKEILNKFYWKQLSKLAADSDILLLEKLGKESQSSEPVANPNSSQRKPAAVDNIVVSQVRKLIENELVSGGKRIIQAETKVREFLQDIYPQVTIVNEKDKTDIIIDKLLDLRLIREEDSHLGKVYEISHDTLLESIIRARAERKKKEDAEKLREGEKLLAEQKRKTDREEKLKEKAREERAAATAAKNEAVQAQKKAKKAEKEALKAKQKAEEERERAVEAERKSKWHLRNAIISLVVAALCGGVVLYEYISLKKEKTKNQENYVQLLKLNAASEYDDDNHALAFNLAQQADSLMDDNHHIVDSFLQIWKPEEYSGRNIQTSLDEKTIACQYKNAVLQIFSIKDSLRRNNPSVLFANADDYTLADDGSSVAIMDTSLQTIRFYSLSNADKRLDTLLLWKQKFTNLSGQVKIMNSSYFISPRPDNSMQIIDFKNHTQTILDSINFAYDDPYYLGKTKLYLHSKSSDNINLVAEINLANDSIILHDQSNLVFDYTFLQHPFLFNKDEKLLYRLSGDSVIPIIDMKQSPPYYFLFTLFETKYYYVLYDMNECIFVNKSNSRGGNLPGIETPEVSTGFSFVRYSDKQVMFINNDSLSLLTSAGRFIRQPINLGNTPRNNSFLNGTAYTYLSADGTKIYCLNVGYGTAGIVSLYPSPHFYKLTAKANGVTTKLRTLDLFETENGLANFDDVKKDRDYWRNYYEQPN